MTRRREYEVMPVAEVLRLWREEGDFGAWAEGVRRLYEAVPGPAARAGLDAAMWLLVVGSPARFAALVRDAVTRVLERGDVASAKAVFRLLSPEEPSAVARPFVEAGRAVLTADVLAAIEARLRGLAEAGNASAARQVRAMERRGGR